MPAIAHIGVGLAAKKLAPGMSVGYLILAAELIEILFFIFVATGLESMPQADKPPFSPFSHSVTMGIVWSLVAAIFTLLISKNKRTAIIIGLLVLSHTILDIIVSPKLAFYPTDIEMPVFFNNSLSIGFGLGKYATPTLILEFGFLIAGFLIYLLTVRAKKASSKGSFQG